LNTADSLVFQTEKQLKEYGEKYRLIRKAAIEAAANKLKEAHKAQDLAAIESAMLN
jgi:molecular chaperone DnaK